MDYLGPIYQANATQVLNLPPAESSPMHALFNLSGIFSCIGFRYDWRWHPNNRLWSDAFTIKIYEQLDWHYLSSCSEALLHDLEW